jgi:DNA-binding HxlR family transcriptional regulator
MKGIWVWPSEPNNQRKILRKIAQEDELVSVLVALTKDPEGLSNAQLDKLLGNNSQWRTLWHLRELIALGFVEYRVQLFGNAGKYELTDLGKTAASVIQASQSVGH